MANVKVDVLGPADLEMIADLYQQVFKPPKDAAFFRRRFMARYNALVMAAASDGRPVGFYLGFELKPTVFFTWLFGVLPDFRRLGIASQLMEASEEWIKHRQYVSIRMECHNQHRPVLHLAIQHKYDIVGIRWDPDRGENLVIFEKMLE